MSRVRYNMPVARHPDIPYGDPKDSDYRRTFFMKNSEVVIGWQKFVLNIINADYEPVGLIYTTRSQYVSRCNRHGKPVDRRQECARRIRQRRGLIAKVIKDGMKVDLSITYAKERDARASLTKGIS